MSYTHKSLALVWFLLLVFLGLSASGVVAGPWVAVLATVALVMPALVLTVRSKPQSPGGAAPTSHGRAPVLVGSLYVAPAIAPGKA